MNDAGAPGAATTTTDPPSNRHGELKCTAAMSMAGDIPPGILSPPPSPLSLFSCLSKSY